MITFKPGADPAERARVERALASFKPTTRPRAMRKPSRRTIEAAGERALTAKDAPLAERDTYYIVRVYYRSAGDEILAFETARLTRGERDAIEAEIARAGMALGRDVLTIDGKATACSAYGFAVERSRFGCRYTCDGPEDKRTARLVVLPSQANDLHTDHSAAWCCAARTVLADRKAA